MATDNWGVDFSFTAAGDLRTKQFYFVKLDSDGKVAVVSALTDRPIGVLQNKPNTGEIAQVRIIGVTKLSADAAVAAGAEICASADGQADDTGTNSFRVGQSLTAAGAGGVIFTAVIDCAPKSAVA